MTTTNESSATTNISDASQLINSAEFKKEENEICFIRAQNCCVVNSTIITSTIDDPEKVRKYYGIFLNTMAAIARESGAKIINNVGDPDSLLT
ncbi:MAG TPA: hypothetical protein VFI73_13160 [Candidatus Nitrosopolaris sp.]|nr:hypothetical protein [Candidatus Nitrosopolaris sp.]